MNIETSHLTRLIWVRGYGLIHETIALCNCKFYTWQDWGILYSDRVTDENRSTDVIILLRDGNQFSCFTVWCKHDPRSEVRIHIAKTSRSACMNKQQRHLQTFDISMLNKRILMQMTLNWLLRIVKIWLGIYSLRTSYNSIFQCITSQKLADSVFCGYMFYRGPVFWQLSDWSIHKFHQE